MEALEPEKKSFENAIEYEIRKLQKQMDTSVSENKRIRAIKWCSIELVKLDEIIRATKGTSLLSDKAGQSLAQTKQVIVDFRASLIDQWQSENINFIRSFENAKTGKLLYLDPTNGLLRVNYDSGLIEICRSCRVLIGLGIPVPVKLQTLALEAEKYQRHTIALNQIANFYNTVDQQILKFQQPLLLGLALKLEKLIKEPPFTLTHDSADKKNVLAYLEMLQKSIDDISLLNRKLQKYHDTIVNIVNELKGIDLVLAQSKWKAKINDIRIVINSAVSDSGAKYEDTLAWRNEIDRLLYNPLDYQFTTGLERIHEVASDVSAEIVFVDSATIAVKPKVSRIKAQFDKVFSTFVAIPTVFKGVGEVKAFPEIAAKSEKLIETAKVRFNTAVAQFEYYVDGLSMWTEIEAPADPRTFSDFEQAVWDIKERGKEVESIPMSVKFGCINVSLAGFRVSLDGMIQKAIDSLGQVLKSNISCEVSQVEEFINQGLRLLTSKPTSLSEVGKAKEQHSVLTKKKMEMQEKIKELVSKTRLLRTMADQSVDITTILDRWNKLQDLLDGHSLMIDEQIKTLKIEVEKKRVSFGQIVTAFAFQANQVVPSSTFEINKEIIDVMAQDVDKLKKDFASVEDFKNSTSFECQYFGVEPLDDSLFVQVSEALAGFLSQWDLVIEYSHEFDKLCAETWAVLRQKIYVADEFLTKWQAKLKAEDKTVCSISIQTQLDSFARLLPVLKYLKGDNWMNEHWGHLFYLIGVPANTKIVNVTFDLFVSKREEIVAKMDEIKKLNERADGEVIIRDTLQRLDVWSSSAVFSWKEWIDSTNLKHALVAELREVFSQISDYRLTLQSLKDSPHYIVFADKLDLWEAKLALIESLLHSLNECQRKWTYLEPIFSNNRFPQSDTFDEASSSIKELFSHLNRDGRVFTLLSFPNAAEKIPQVSASLDVCQKAVADYLEGKRSVFTRFYFLNDDDLLQILALKNDIEPLQKFFPKLFTGIHRILYQDGHVVACLSFLGEKVELLEPVKIDGPVESWMALLDIALANTLRNLLKQYLGRDKVDVSFPSQIICLGENIKFTCACENAVANGNAALLASKIETSLVEASQVFQGSDSQLMSSKKQAYILDRLRNLDCVRDLVNKKISDVDDWAWRKRVRFYYDQREGCKIAAGYGSFEYTFEYQGNPELLVHTELTEKCYTIMTDALHNGLGGNPYGPAGTGKTESVKSLGYYFGRQVLVFNCDESMDAESIARILIGVVTSGCWACFDEFNRLEQSVLSATSTIIQTIQNGITSRSSHVSIQGKMNVPLNFNSGIFVTLNPAGKKYGGRSKLPENIKRLLRPNAMTLPNTQKIVEASLISAGFKKAQLLASKLVCLNQLASQVLSSQGHYEWGLRPIKTVLRSAIKLKGQREGSDVENEEEIIVLSARNTIGPRLTPADVVKFDSLIRSVFQIGILPDGIDHGLDKHINSYASENGIVLSAEQLEKIHQLHKALKQRTGVILLGPARTGKTMVREALEFALKESGSRLSVIVVGPKAVDRNMLLGYVDPLSREWQDGVVTRICRDISINREKHFWLVFDGSVDPEWIESFNSVLDDNRTLTLSNGERISLGTNFNFLFECCDLKFASPATISRMDIVSISGNAYQPVAERSSFTTSSSLCDSFKQLINCGFGDFLEQFHSAKGHFSVSGPDGPIKSRIVQLACDSLSFDFQEIHLTSSVSHASFVRNILSKCLVFEGPNGKTLRPRKSAGLVLYVSRISATKVDKYSHNQIVELLHLMCSLGILWISPSECLKISNIHVVISTNGSQSLSDQLSCWSRCLGRLMAVDLPCDRLRDPSVTALLVPGLAQEDVQLLFNLSKNDQWASIESNWSFNPSVPLDAFYSSLHKLWSIFSTNGSERIFHWKGDWINFDEYSSVMSEQIKMFQREDRQLALIPEVTLVVNSLGLLNLISSATNCGLILEGTAGDLRNDLISLNAYNTGARLVRLRLHPWKVKQHFDAVMKEVLSNVILKGEQVIIALDSNSLNPLVLDGLTDLLCCEVPQSTLKDDESRTLLSEVKNICGSLSVDEFIERRLKRIRLVFLVDSDEVEELSSNYPSLLSTCIRIDFSGCIQDRNVIGSQFAKYFGDEHIDVTAYADHLVSLSRTMENQKLPKLTHERLVSIISMHSDIFRTKHQQIKNQVDHYQKGLAAVETAMNDVQRLRENVAKQEKELLIKQRNADEALKHISESMSTSTAKKSEIEQLKGKLTIEERQISQRKDMVDKQIGDVEPLMRKAKEAIGEIRPESLTEIRSMRAPPAAVRDVLEGVLRLMGLQDTSWNNMKSFLGRRSVKDEIIDFDARRISVSDRNAVKKLMEEKPESFEESSIKRVSSAAAPLASWIKANILYMEVLKSVAPLESELSALTKNLDTLASSISLMQQDLVSLDRQVAEFRDEFSQRTKEAELLRMKYEETKKTLEDADNFVSSMSDEYSRWKSRLSESSKRLETVLEESFVASVFLNCCGAIVPRKRDAFVDSLCQLLGIEVFSVSRFLLLDNERDEWLRHGLPDETSLLESALILSKARVAPLIIDPSGEIVDWLCKSSVTKCERISQHDPKLKQIVELAVRIGKTLIIEEVSSVPHEILPILFSDIDEHPTKKVLHLYDKELDLCSGFRLFLACRKLPDLSESMMAKLSIVDFSTTPDSLEKALNTEIIAFAEPEIEAKRVELSKAESQASTEIRDIEQAILEQLSKVQSGHLINDIPLLESLERSKTRSVQLSQTLAQIHEMTLSMSQRVKEFRPVASQATKCFILIQKLQTLNSFYNVSYVDFRKVFSASLKETQVTSRFSQELLINLCRNCFILINSMTNELEAGAFGLLLMNRVFPDLVPVSLLDEFLGKNEALMRKEVPKWIEAHRSRDYSRVLALFPGFAAITSSKKDWDRLTRTCSLTDLFGTFKDLSPFAKVLAIHSLQVRHTLSVGNCFTLTEVNQFICKSLGIESLRSPIEEVAIRSLASDPILVTVSDGINPLAFIKTVMSRRSSSCQLIQIPIGSVTLQDILSRIESESQLGNWMLIENVHLCIEWLHAITQRISQLPSQGASRVWLTSSRESEIPASVVLKCQKINLQVPKGISETIKRHSTPSQTQHHKALTLLHSVLVERERFVPQGWSKKCEFSSSDLELAFSSSCSSQKALQGYLADVVYPGRIETPIDDEILKTIVESTLSQTFIENPSLIEDDTLFTFLPNNMTTSEAMKMVDLLKEKLRMVGSTAADAASESQEESLPWKKETVAYLQIWKTVRRLFTAHEKIVPSSSILDIEIPKVDPKDVWKSFLAQLMRKIHQDFAFTAKALKAGGECPSEVTRLGLCLAQNKVPEEWEALFSGAENAISFIQHAQKIFMALQDMIKSEVVPRGSYVIQPVMFMRPRALISILSLVKSQEKSIPIDKLRLQLKWTDKASGTFVKGLFVQGCRFDGKSLLDNDPSDPPLLECPIACVCWDEMIHGETEDTLQVPLYEDPSRENLVAMVSMPTTETKKWRLAGVALFLRGKI